MIKNFAVIGNLLQNYSKKEPEIRSFDLKYMT